MLNFKIVTKTTKMITHQLGRHSIKPIQTLLRRDKSYDVVIAGGGSGGISVAARLAKKLGKGKVAVIEPSSVSFFFGNCLI